MKKQICGAVARLVLAAVCLSLANGKGLAYDILNSKWGVGPNNAYFINPSSPPASAGAVTWSPMPSGLAIHPNASGYDGHGDLSTDIEFLITPAVDGLEYALFDAALNKWGEHANITNLGQVADSGAQVGAPESQGGHIGDIRAAGYSFDGYGGGLAHALQPATEGMGTTFGGDVHFDIAEAWVDSATPSGGQTDFFTVALHELGHSLGLGHSNTSASVMYFAYQGAQRELFLDDIIGIQALYGTEYAANASFESGSDVNSINVDFGSFSLGDPVAPVSFDISNLASAGSTATLSHASSIGSGDSDVLTTDFNGFLGVNNLLAGDTSSSFNAMFDTNAPGNHAATWDLNFMDVTGTNQTLTVNMTGSVANLDDPSKPDLVYDVTTGEVWIDPRDISTINLYNLQSDYAFIGANHTPVLGGVVTSEDHDISEATFSSISTPQSIGNILPSGLTLTDLSNTITTRVATAVLGQPEVQFDLEITCGAGDANCDGYVDISSDIFPAFSNFTGPGTFSVLREDGDVNGHPTGDDDIDVQDLLAMFGAFTGPPPDNGGLAPAAAADPNIPDLIYDPTTGEVVLDVDGSGIIGYVLKNGTSSFIAGAHTPFLAGVSTSLPGELSEAAFASPSGANSIGFVFPTGMDLAALTSFLTANEVSRSLGAPVVAFDLVVLGGAVPEPSTFVLAGFGLLSIGFFAYRRKRA